MRWIKILLLGAGIALMAGACTGTQVTSTPQESMSAKPVGGEASALQESVLAAPGGDEAATFASPLAAPGEAGSTTFVSPLATLASAACHDLTELQRWVGSDGCIEAIVQSSENWSNDFVMWFQKEPVPFYAIVRNTLYLGVEGSCLRIDGKLERDDEGRLFIRADSPGQVAPCQQ